MRLKSVCKIKTHLDFYEYRDNFASRDSVNFKTFCILRTGAKVELRSRKHFEPKIKLINSFTQKWSDMKFKGEVRRKTFTAIQVFGASLV